MIYSFCIRFVSLCLPSPGFFEWCGHWHLSGHEGGLQLATASLYQGSGVENENFCGWNHVPMYLWFVLNATCFETKGPEKCLVWYQVWCESCTFIATDFRNDEIILFCAEMLEKSTIKVSKAWIHAERRNYFRCKAGLHIQALAELRSGLLQKQQGRKQLLKQLLRW